MDTATAVEAIDVRSVDRGAITLGVKRKPRRVSNRVTKALADVLLLQLDLSRRGIERSTYFKRDVASGQ